MGNSTNKASVTGEDDNEETEGVLKLQGTGGADLFITNSEPPNEQEKIQLQELEERLQREGLFDQPCMRSHWKLLRFLRGYKHDVNLAAEAFDRMATFREESDILSIRNELLEIEEKTGALPFPYDLPAFAPLVNLIGKGLLHRHGFDKQGNLLTTVLVGEWRVKLVAAKGKDMEELLIRGQMYLDEYFDIVLHRLTEERGLLVRRHDLLSVSNPSIGVLQFTPGAIGLIQKSTAGSQHYPEAVARVTSCGNGMFALGLWKLINPFVPEHTKRKIQVLGTTYYPNLLEVIEENEIPDAFRQTKV